MLKSVLLLRFAQLFRGGRRRRVDVLECPNVRLRSPFGDEPAHVFWQLRRLGWVRIASARPGRAAPQLAEGAKIPIMVWDPFGTLRRVLWIGGGQWAGKSTVARILAVRHGITAYHYDYHDGRGHDDRRVAERLR